MTASSSPEIVTHSLDYVEFLVEPNDDELLLPPVELDGYDFLVVNSYVRGDETKARARVAIDMTHLLGVIDPAYDDADDDDERFRIRYFMARDAADTMQRYFNGRSMDDGIDLTGPESQVLWREKDDPPVFDMAWDDPTPLLLVRTDYQPFTDRPLPEGVTWIDPTTESDLLSSLHAAGFVLFAEHVDSADNDDE